ncbi:hypothetical protein HOY80DRAFT_890580, partial [Tuber brumale]
VTINDIKGEHELNRDLRSNEHRCISLEQLCRGTRPKKIKTDKEQLYDMAYFAKDIDFLTTRHLCSAAFKPSIPIIVQADWLQDSAPRVPTVLTPAQKGKPAVEHGIPHAV